MKAITIQRYGGPEVLELSDVDDPIVGDDEVLVRVRAASANPRDWHYMRGSPFLMRPTLGWRRPKKPVLGSCLAGVVEAAGPGVTRFRPGDEVMADIEAGAFAEAVAVPESLVGPKPANLSFEEAAAVPLAAVTALQGLRDAGRVEAGQRVLIIGAGGGVGTFAVQLAKHLGAEVTGVCSTGKVDLVRSLGADRVIDYTREPFTAGDPHDVVFQLAGTASARACRRALTRSGTLVMGSGEARGHWFGPLARIAAGVVTGAFVSQRVVAFIAKPSQDDLREIAGLIEAGTVRVVVDRTYSLAEVPDAIRHVEEGHPRGKVVVTLAPG
jgi:NADPH:quinone reductase-like Zn-dependent oxidoreductase